MQETPKQHHHHSRSHTAVSSADSTNPDHEYRVLDVSTWLENERDELKYNIHQTHDLLDLKDRLELMLKGIQTPLEITQENLLTRETRQGAELVHDAVEECLHKELESLKKNHEKLALELEKINGQVTRLRGSRRELESDIKSKDDTKKTEECVKILARLQEDLAGIDIPEGLLTTNNNASTNWLPLTQSIIKKSQDERNSAQLLYAEVSRSMLSSADECFTIWYDTNASFSTRVVELVSGKHQIEKQLNRIKHDIDSLGRRMAVVRNTLDEKLSLLRLAQARLEKRRERPGIELCRDKMLVALLKEINTLKNIIEQLQAKLKEMEATMNQFLKNKATLDRDIKLKDIALFIDREKCLTLRQNFPMSTFKESRFPKGYNGMPVTPVTPKY